jgi:hypothetical protein
MGAEHSSVKLQNATQYPILEYHNLYTSQDLRMPSSGMWRRVRLL